jgi:hypothetical protein
MSQLIHTNRLFRLPTVYLPRMPPLSSFGSPKAVMSVGEPPAAVQTPSTLMMPLDLEEQVQTVTSGLWKLVEGNKIDVMRLYSG